MKKSVLVVDDQEDIRLMVTKMLSSKCSANIAAVSSIREAIAVLQRDPVAVIVCDYQMPDEHGLLLLDYVIACNLKSWFILYTAEEGLFEKSGYDKFILVRKPNFRELITYVNEALLVG